MRPSSVFACQSCGFQAPKWLGRCPGCGEWNSFVEELRDQRPPFPRAGESRAVAITSVEIEQGPRLSTGLADFDRVLGGGLVQGSLVLLGGEPGVGKSTLLLQAAREVARAGRAALYVSGEESARQVRLRAERIGAIRDGLFLLPETDVLAILAEAERLKPALLIVDSIQAVSVSSLASPAGTVSQVRESAAQFLRLSKARGMPTLLVGHVTKDGALAGPKVLEHVVDAVIAIEGEQSRGRRVLRASKNRFGAVDEIALFEMTADGLSAIPNPSAALLAERRADMPGSCVAAAMEGTRALLVEVQALVGPVAEGSPRRVAIGVDSQRLALLLAVLEAEAGIALSRREVFVSCAGGVEAREPGIDLAMAAALVSSARQRSLPADSVAFGEVGLLGEVRRVADADARLQEAASLGFRTVYLPSGDAGALGGFPGLSPRPVDRVADLARALAAETPLSGERRE